MKYEPAKTLFIANAVLIFKFSGKKSKAWKENSSQYLTALTEYLVCTEYSVLNKWDLSYLQDVPDPARHTSTQQTLRTLAAVSLTSSCHSLGSSQPGREACDSTAPYGFSPRVPPPRTSHCLPGSVRYILQVLVHMCSTQWDSPWHLLQLKSSAPWLLGTT